MFLVAQNDRRSAKDTPSYPAPFARLTQWTGTLAAFLRADPPHGGTDNHSEDFPMLNRSMTNTIDRMMTLNRALDEAFSSSVKTNDRVWVPAVDLFETKDAYVVRADLPGVERQSIDISFEKNILTISGHKAAGFENRDEEVRVYAAERVSGAFSRALRMPDHIDGDRIEADFKDGLLTVTVPKAAVAQPRKIEVK
jgi:HSP20 family protein